MKPQSPVPQAALAAWAGAALVLAFPPFDLWVAAALCPAPLCWVVSRPHLPRRTAGLAGFWFGMTFFAGTTYWVVPVMRHYGGLSWLVALCVLILMVAVLACFFVVFALLVHSLAGRLGAAAALALAPATWVMMELARNYLLTGFPWTRLGTALHGLPSILQVASIAGVYGLSFLLLAVAASLALVAQDRRSIVGWSCLALALGACAGLHAWGTGRVGALAAEGASSDMRLKVACVQGNIPQDQKWDAEEAERILARQVELTRIAVARGAELVVWPESSLPFPLRRKPRLARDLAEVTRSSGASLIVGSLDVRPESGGRIYNSAFLLAPGQAPRLAYDKAHLVPFGEYVPLRRWLFFASKLVEEVGELSPGSGEQGLLSGDGSPRLGVLICYEIIFPEMARRAARSGAQVLLNLTNDAWFGTTSAPSQHFSEAVVRAVETGRWVVRAANTGISGIIAPTGQVFARTTLGVATLAEAEVALRGEQTVYVRFGDAFAWACVIVTACAALLAWSSSRRSGGS